MNTLTDKNIYPSHNIIFVLHSNTKFIDTFGIMVREKWSGTWLNGMQDFVYVLINT